MYISIGGEALIRAGDIIGIFDLDNTSQSKITREFLNTAESQGRMISEVQDLPKSFVVTKDNVQLSVLNSSTLVKRIR